MRPRGTRGAGERPMPDLTARLLAEIERRAGQFNGAPAWEIAYLAALKAVVQAHTREDCDLCTLCWGGGGTWPCDTVREIAGAVEVPCG